jgi:hypothetical protein
MNAEFDRLTGLADIGLGRQFVQKIESAVCIDACRW